MKAIAVMTRLNVQRREDAPVVEPGEEGDRQHDEGRLVQFAFIPRQHRHLRDEVAERDGVGRFQHRVGEHEVEADVEGHERTHDMLGLRVLTAGGGDG